MFKSVIFYISLRYIYGNSKCRFTSITSNLSVISVMLGVTSLIIITSVMNGFEHSLQQNILTYIPQVILTTSKGNLNPNQYPIKSISHLQGIHHITSIIESDVVLQSKQNIGFATMIGVEENSNDPLFNYLQDIDSTILTAGSYHVILGIKLAKQLKVKRGDQLRLIVPGVIQFTPIGKLPSQRLFTVVGFFITQCEADSSELLVNQQDAVRLMHYPIGNITGWRLYLDLPLTVNTLSKQILPSGMIWKDWREKKGEFFQAIKIERNTICLLLSLIIIGASFNIITSLSLLVTEKKSEIAILQTLGLKRYQIIIIFILQGVTKGIIGTSVGTILGILITNNINTIISMFNVLAKGIKLPVIIEFNCIIVIIVFSISVSLLATIYPSWCAANIQVVKALYYE